MAEAQSGGEERSGRGLLLSLHSALRALKLYPVENATVQKTLDELVSNSTNFLAAENEIEIRLSGDFMFLNSVRLRLELDNFAAFSGVVSMLRAFDIGVLRLHPGVERRRVGLPADSSATDPSLARSGRDRRAHDHARRLLAGLSRSGT